jgi:hypothetical protein
LKWNLVFYANLTVLVLGFQLAFYTRLNYFVFESWSLPACKGPYCSLLADFDSDGSAYERRFYAGSLICCHGTSIFMLICGSYGEDGDKGRLP